MAVVERPAPPSVSLDLRERRSVAICEVYSCRLRRTVVVHERAYWVLLWLDWAPDVANFAERPQTPGRKGEWLADFWVENRSGELLLDTRLEPEPPNRVQLSPAPWSLEGADCIAADSGVLSVGAAWHWSRRGLLLNLERAQPFTVAAALGGGYPALANSVRQVVAGTPTTVQHVIDRIGGEEHATMCALFAEVKGGRLRIDWTKPLNRMTRVEATHA